MSIRYSKLFNIPRKIAKHTLKAFYPLVIKIWPLPNVLSIDVTLDKILKDKVSIARFGDGEFLFILDKIGLPFQGFDNDLRKRLMEVLISQDERILIGLPICYHSLDNLTRKSKLTWKSHIVWAYPRLRKKLDLSKVYYNAHITRPFNNFKKKNDSIKYFNKLKEIWKNREIILVEGEKSRLGVGNDLFNDVKCLIRVLAPSENAFNRYNELLYAIQMHEKTKLVLIALGPTATVLSFDLTKLGYQALDIGNIDIEYEWYLRDAKSKIKIPGKYTNEAPGGKEVEDVNDPLYESQIIARIF